MASRPVGCGSPMNAAARSWRLRFSPLGRWSDVHPRQVQTVLRQAFERWGRPGQVRVDNGAPWGSASDLPTELSLWLVGLQVTTIANPPRQPQKNGGVERSQGTGKRWAEP